MGSAFKRAAAVPPVARMLADKLSKADLLEAAWHLAGLASGEYGDSRSHLVRLVEELQTIRENTSRPKLKIPHVRRSVVLASGNVSATPYDQMPCDKARCPACVLGAGEQALDVERVVYEKNERALAKMRRKGLDV